jgi:hypothetical protein
VRTASTVLNSHQDGTETSYASSGVKYSTIRVPWIWKKANYILDTPVLVRSAVDGVLF